MADFERISLIKKSVYNFLSAELLKVGYVIGEGVGEIRFFNAYPPVDESGSFIAFELPAIALDFTNERPRTQEDLGTTCKYGVELDIDVFGRNDLEKETLLGTIRDIIEKNSIPYMDYNVTPSTRTSYLRNSECSDVPIRVESPGSLEKFWGKFSFITTLLQDY